MLAMNMKVQAPLMISDFARAVAWHMHLGCYRNIRGVEGCLQSPSSAGHMLPTCYLNASQMLPRVPDMLRS